MPKSDSALYPILCILATAILYHHAGGLTPYLHEASNIRQHRAMNITFMSSLVKLFFEMHFTQPQFGSYSNAKLLQRLNTRYSAVFNLYRHPHLPRDALPRSEFSLFMTRSCRANKLVQPVKSLPPITPDASPNMALPATSLFYHKCAPLGGVSGTQPTSRSNPPYYPAKQKNMSGWVSFQHIPWLLG